MRGERRFKLHVELQNREVSALVEISYVNGRVDVTLTDVLGRSGSLFHGAIAIDRPLASRSGGGANLLLRALDETAALPALPDHVVYGLGWMMWIRKNQSRLQLELDVGVGNPTIGGTMGGTAEIALHFSEAPEEIDDNFEFRLSGQWEVKIQPLH